MMRRHGSLRIHLIVWASMLASGAHAELIDRGGGLIYDTEADVTWLQDANYAMTSGFSQNGRMTWEDAMSWAADLEYYDTVRDTTWSDWRLPDSRQPDGSWPCFGLDCPDSEQGRLYEVYELRCFAQGPFVNFDRGSYWAGTRQAPLPGNAWLFNFTLGKQDHTGPFEELLVGFAHLVRDGDVGPAPPDVPSLGRLGLLVLSALLAIATWLPLRASKRAGS